MGTMIWRYSDNDTIHVSICTLNAKSRCDWTTDSVSFFSSATKELHTASSDVRACKTISLRQRQESDWHKSFIWTKEHADCKEHCVFGAGWLYRSQAPTPRHVHAVCRRTPGASGVEEGATYNRGSRQPDQRQLLLPCPLTASQEKRCRRLAHRLGYGIAQGRGRD